MCVCVWFGVQRAFPEGSTGPNWILVAGFVVAELVFSLQFFLVFGCQGFGCNSHELMPSARNDSKQNLFQPCSSTSGHLCAASQPWKEKIWKRASKNCCELEGKGHRPNCHKASDQCPKVPRSRCSQVLASLPQSDHHGQVHQQRDKLHHPDAKRHLPRELGAKGGNRFG